MELLIGKGEFEIISETTDLLATIKKAACTSHQSEHRTHKDPKDFAQMLVNIEHWSVFDHVSVTVHFKNVSRGFTHELVRHRIAAFTQESTRYVDPTEDPVTRKPGEVNLRAVCPPHRDHTTLHQIGSSRPQRWLSFEGMMNNVEEFYKALRKSGWAQEDARQILPIGTKSDIVMTADMTEWRHVFTLRTQKAAHWEIRSVMCAVLVEFRERYAPIFDDFHQVGRDKNGVVHFSRAKEA